MAIESCTIESSESTTTNAGTELRVIFNIKADQYTLANDVEALARSASPDPLPLPSSTLSLSTISKTDSNLIAHEVRVRPKDGTNQSFIGEVLYRTQSIATNRPRFETPDKQPPIFWTEDLVETVERDRGKNRQPIKFPWLNADESAPAKRPAGTEGTITNAAGFRYGTLPTLQTRKVIFVMEKNILNPFVWLGLRAKFENRINENDWNLFGLRTASIRKAVGTNVLVPQTRGITLKARTAMLWEMVANGPNFFGKDLQFWRLQTRILYDPGEHVIKIRNEGDKVWFRATDGVWSFETPTRQGLTLPPPIPLDKEGRIKASVNEAADILEFDDLKTRNFDELSSELNSLV